MEAASSARVLAGEDRAAAAGVASAVWIAAYVSAVAIVLLINLPLLDYLSSKPPGRSVITDVVYGDLIKAELVTYSFQFGMQIAREAGGVVANATANALIWVGLSFYGIFMAQMVTTSVMRYLVIFHFSFVNEISDAKVILFSRMASVLTGTAVASLEMAITGFRMSFFYKYLTGTTCCEVGRERTFMTIPILLYTCVATVVVLQGLVVYKRLVFWKMDSDVVRKMTEASQRLDTMRARAARACLSASAETPFHRLREDNSAVPREDSPLLSSALPRYALATVVTLLILSVLIFLALSDVLNKYRPRGVVLIAAGFTGVLMPCVVYFTNASLRQHVIKRIKELYTASHRNVVSPA